jgi:hypothetical protein
MNDDQYCPVCGEDCGSEGAVLRHQCSPKKRSAIDGAHKRDDSEPIKPNRKTRLKDGFEIQNADGDD